MFENRSFLTASLGLLGSAIGFIVALSVTRSELSGMTVSAGGKLSIFPAIGLFSVCTIVGLALGFWLARKISDRIEKQAKGTAHRPEIQARRSFIQWLNIAEYFVILAMISVLVSAGVVIANMKPNFRFDIGGEIFSNILLLQVFGILLPFAFIAIAITNPPPKPLTAAVDLRRRICRVFVPLLLALLGAALVWAAFARKKPGTGMRDFTNAILIASALQPFVWLGFGLALSTFRTYCENSSSTTGIATLTFFTCGYLPLVAFLVNFMLKDRTLFEMVIPPVLGVLLLIGMASLGLALSASKIEHERLLQEANDLRTD